MVKCPGDPCEVPDYTIYSVDDIPQLVKTQEKLDNLCLEDPWARNEVWRYKIGVQSKLKRWRMLILRGFVPGLIAAVLSTAYTFSSKIEHHPHEDHVKEETHEEIDKCGPRK